MSKEEILNEACKGQPYPIGKGEIFTPLTLSWDNSLQAMQTYADQETAPLKDRIAQLESELQMLQDYLIKEGK